MSALQTLVVDDSASARTVLKRLLERKGVQVDQTESGLQALDYLKTKKPDLIFMDHTMPGMSGLEAVRAIRKDPATASIPVVMYTSQSDENYLQEALATGALDIIPKPATWNKLSQVLDAVSHQRQIMTDDIAASIDQQLSSLRDHLSFAMEQQIQRVCDELRVNFEQRVRALESRQNTPSPYPSQGLSTLIHSITDSKLHQLNLELRHHLSAKLDVLSQDLLQHQQEQRQELLRELELRLRQERQGAKKSWWQRFPGFIRSRWYVLPFWLAVALMAALWGYWNW
jgi:CheY-like chemotaxis protein